MIIKNDDCMVRVCDLILLDESNFVKWEKWFKLDCGVTCGCLGIENEWPWATSLGSNPDLT